MENNQKDNRTGNDVANTEAVLLEILSDATGIPVCLVEAETQFQVDLNLSLTDLVDFQIAAEHEFGIQFDGTDWLQHADCVASLAAYIGHYHADSGACLESMQQALGDSVAKAA